jgi:hypothetical protein
MHERGKTRVLVAFKNSTKFSPLLPPGGPSKDGGCQLFPAGRTQVELSRGEVPMLLKEIKQVNQEFAIVIKKGAEVVGTLPNLGGVAEGFC